MDNELKTLELYIEEIQTRFAGRRRLRESNCQGRIEYPNDEQLSKLDSSIKKNSAFVKKLKVFTESQKEHILSEIDRLNLTKFISEVASSIIEAKLKLSDIPAIVEICCKLNRIYKDFCRHLLDQYSRYFPTIKRRNYDCNSAGTHLSSHSPPSSSNSSISSPSSSSAPSNASANRGQVRPANEVSPLNLSKIRVDLRLFAELIIAGIFPPKDGFPILVNLLCYLIFCDKNSYQNANAILTLCKGCGDELLGLFPRRIRASAREHNVELPTSELIPAKRQETLKGYIHEYFHSLVEHLKGLHSNLEELIVRNKRVFKSRGEVTKESRELAEVKHQECLKVQNILCQLSELIEEDVPEFPDLEALKADADQNDDEAECLPDSSVVKIRGSCSVWDDEGTKSFYEDLVDLKQLFPNLTIRISSGKLENDKAAVDEIDQREANTDKDTKAVTNDDSRNSTPTRTVEEVEKPLSSGSSDESLPGGDSASPPAAPLVMSRDVATRAQPDGYFAKLSHCVNRDMIDSAAIDFIRFFNTKFGRRKLVKTLFNVQRTRLDLLPFFARLTATLYRFVPGVGNELVSLLKQDFKNLFKKKDQINIESKVKNVRFIGELVKFNLYSKQEALYCLKSLLSDFTHHHIEMTCNLLETCGRILYKSPDSHQQTRLLLEQMMRKKQLLSVDSKYITMIENAYYFTDPPDIVRHVVEEPPIHIYVRYLLCECLNRSTIDKVLQKIKKLNWSDKGLAKFMINCMIEAYNVKFYNIRYLAALLAALNREHNWISVAVIDGVVEDILLMMEVNEIHFNQRRIPMIRYFGELFNYRLSDSSLVFKVLYSLITYGVYYPEPEQTLTQIPMSHLDTPENLFRIKLVCDLLETCGQYLSCSGPGDKRKLDCYLLFFQRYYWCKKHIYLLHPYCVAKSGNQFPAAIEYLYRDAIYNLRPTFQMATSYAEAIEALQSFVDNLLENQATPASASSNV